MRVILNFFKQNYFLVLIVILAILLRFIALTWNPPSLNYDEVSHGYNAYSILNTGRDEWGFKLPTIFRAYGDNKLPVYIYVTAISEKVFGLTDFAVRLPSALAGVGVVIFTFFLASELFKNRTVAYLSSFLVAIEPWSLFLSRGAFEANLSLFFITTGLYYFLRARENPKYLIGGTFVLGLSVWTYNSARIFAPLFIVVFLLIYRSELINNFKKNKTIFVTALFIGLLLFVPMFIQLLEPIGQARYNKVSIINGGSIARIDEARNASKLPSVLNKAINNRYIYFTGTFAKNWISHYTPKFLFLEGGTNFQFSVPGKGLLYLTDIIPILVGLLWLFKNKTKESFLIFSWLALSTVPSALTNEAPHVLRSIVMLPAPMIVSSYGAFLIYKWVNQNTQFVSKFLIVGSAIILYVMFTNYLSTYMTYYREHYSWSWQYGYSQAVSYISENYNSYDKIIVTKAYGEPHEYLLFYSKYSPSKYLSDSGKISFFQSDWWWVDRFDKFWFVNDWQVKDMVTESKIRIDCAKIRCLLVTSPGNYPVGWKRINTINFLDGKAAFEIFNNE